YSGVKFDNRPAFTEMMELAKAGRINCIIVKDFSRFGRDYVELGDYLEQYFPFLGIRFISVNDGYDSRNFEGTTGGLDVAFKNMIYDFYSREFSKKQKIAWRRMAEKGEYNATFTMYGYRRDRGSIHQLVIHEETGEVVREIFSLAASGMSPLKIAQLLNEKGIPSPSETQNMQGYRQEWGIYGVECHWTAEKIRRMIRDERYTGTMVSLKTSSFMVGGKRVRTAPSEWVRVENTHEPLVSYELYLKANSVIKQTMFKQSGRKGKNIYHCGYCGRKLQNAGRGIIQCGQRYLVKECSCRGAAIKREEADRAVMDALKQQIQLFVKESKLSQNARDKTIPYSADGEIMSLTKTIAALKKTWMPLYEQYM
ncbi:MAG: recombinase family protein, partial [Lachnospiraceae bacterium]|nr:recombinase family protein [Lachnospiraceae bacterium]